MARSSIAFALALLVPAPAAAERGFSIGAKPAWFVTGGATGGGTVVADDRGGFAGGELSVVRVRENRFAGLYGDALYDFGGGATYLTFGPELGLVRRSRAMPIAVGVDGGAALRIDGDTAWGAAGRVFVGFAGAVALYARYVYLDSDEGDGGDGVVQVGMTVKFPLAVW
jgi:hypothetical protein